MANKMEPEFSGYLENYTKLFTNKLYKALKE